MNPDDIKVSRVYAARRPVKRHDGLYNDRSVIYIGTKGVQYDSPTVPNGRKYPTVPLERFAEWAGSDVTDVTPPGDWRTWRG